MTTSSEEQPPFRLGVYADLRYMRSGDTVSTEAAFGRFLLAVAEAAGGLTLFGRMDPRPGIGSVELPASLIHFVELPTYPSLRLVTTVLLAGRRSVGVITSHLPELDALWLFGPHPLGLVFARRARRSRVVVALGIRQDFRRYVAWRSSRPLRPFATAAAALLEWRFRALARISPTVVVGEDLGRRWRRAAPALLVTSFSLVTEADLVPEADAGRQPWREPRQILSVGRLDAEKNPLLLADLALELGPQWHIRVLGDGPMRAALEQRARALAVTERLELLGHVSFGDDLRSWYRKSDGLVHVSRTEGVPQVLFEAMAAGLPIVATAVGGVAEALAGGARGLLAPPDDAAAVAVCLRRLANDGNLRRDVALAGRRAVAELTLDQQAGEAVDFLASSIVAADSRS